MDIIARNAPLGLLLLALTACGETKEPDRGVVKSVHGDDPKRPYVVCQAGSTYREVNLSEAILKQVKVGDSCPTWEMPYPTATTTERSWR